MQLLKFVPVAAAVLTLAACSSVNTKLVHDTVLPEYSPAANMGDVLDVWAACKKGTQKWTEIKEDGNDYVWKDGKKATREAEFLKLAYDGSLATDTLQYIDNPEKLSFTVESYAQILGPFYLEMRQAR